MILAMVIVTRFEESHLDFDKRRQYPYFYTSDFFIEVQMKKTGN